MNIVVVSASLKSKSFYSTGYILLNSDGTGGKGLFAFDYIELSLLNKELKVRLCEKTFDDEDTEKYGFGANIVTNYKSVYEGTSIYVPEKYKLYNNNSEMIVLSLKSLVNNDTKIARFLEELTTIQH